MCKKEAKLRLTKNCLIWHLDLFAFLFFCVYMHIGEKMEQSLIGFGVEISQQCVRGVMQMNQRLLCFVTVNVLVGDWSQDLTAGNRALRHFFSMEHEQLEKGRNQVDLPAVLGCSEQL